MMLILSPLDVGQKYSSIGRWRRPLRRAGETVVLMDFADVFLTRDLARKRGELPEILGMVVLVRNGTSIKGPAETGQSGEKTEQRKFGEAGRPRSSQEKPRPLPRLPENAT